MLGLAGMKTRWSKASDEQFLYLRRPGLQILEGAEGYAEFIITVLNRVIGDADEAGESVRLRYRDAGVVDRSGDRLEGIEWVTAAGQVSSIEEMDVVSITGAAQLLGMSRSALKARVFRAHRAGKTTPFFWSKASKIWLATPASVKTWAASRTRVDAKRKAVST